MCENGELRVQNAVGVKIEVIFDHWVGKVVGIE